MLSFQMTQGQITGEKAIIQNPSENVKATHKECVFLENEVYALDILMSSGEGKAKQGDARTTVFKATDETYMLRSKYSRALLSEARSQFQSFPFTIRSCKDEIKARMGVKECVEHNLLEPYHVLYERPGEFVAQFRFTVIVRSKNNEFVTNVPLNRGIYQSEYSIDSTTDSDLLAAIQQLNKAPKKKKNKNKSKSKNKQGPEKTDAPA
eukprot:gene8648-10300_t